MSNSEVLGPYDIGGVKRPRVEFDGKDGELSQLIEEQGKRKKEKKEKKERKEKKAKKERKPSKEKEEVISDDEEEQEDANLTLAERLNRLSKQVDDFENEQYQEETEVAKTNQKPGTSFEVSIPTADSLVTLLEQSLQSGDSYLLEQCLGCNNLEIIDSTVRKLPMQRVLVLLKTLVAKFERRPSRGILVTHWISCILKHHLSYLITVPDLSHQLAGLSQILEQRTAVYSKLATLAGRLDLLMSQVVRQQNANTIEPKVVYEF